MTITIIKRDGWYCVRQKKNAGILSAFRRVLIRAVLQSPEGMQQGKVACVHESPKSGFKTLSNQETRLEYGDAHGARSWGSRGGG